MHLYVYAYVCIRVHTYTYVYTRACVHVRVYAYTYVRIHAREDNSKDKEMSRYFNIFPKCDHLPFKP